MPQPNNEEQLADAVYRTANKLLDPPPYIYANFITGDSRKRLASVLKGTPYVEMALKDYNWKFHPLVVEYYKQWGDRFIQCLEATLRLQQ